ncbi:MAG TPA: KGG domain-containing protein [Chthonomonadaceae bacterium]|jgi:general stress protein YciG|nr:KGG domain-containing protein [Chthonomonadaceae bacterium]
MADKKSSDDKRGFASMDEEKRREIARKGGEASHGGHGKAHSDREGEGEGRGWHGDPQGHAQAGRKGGEEVSKDREHMAEIGRKGGEARAKDND